MKNKGCHSNGENLNMHRYMHHSSKNLDSRQTATTTTALTATSKWVINMSSVPLTEVQKQLLALGPNFAIFPRSPPIKEYIIAVAQTCQSLAQGGRGTVCRGEGCYKEDSSVLCYNRVNTGRVKTPISN